MFEHPIPETGNNSSRDQTESDSDSDHHDDQTEPDLDSDHHDTDDLGLIDGTYNNDYTNDNDGQLPIQMVNVIDNHEIPDTSESTDDNTDPIAIEIKEEMNFVLLDDADDNEIEGILNANDDDGGDYCGNQQQVQSNEHENETNAVDDEEIENISSANNDNGVLEQQTQSDQQREQSEKTVGVGEKNNRQNKKGDDKDDEEKIEIVKSFTIVHGEGFPRPIKCDFDWMVKQENDSISGNLPFQVTVR